MPRSVLLDFGATPILASFEQPHFLRTCATRIGCIQFRPQISRSSSNEIAVILCPKLFFLTNRYIVKNDLLRVLHLHRFKEIC
jgi:hypothetical protein